MRLPNFLTTISPIGETLEAVEQGASLLEQEAARRNAQLSVTTAEEGLSLWEADYSLPDAGADTALRRARIHTAITGEQTLTPKRLAELAVTVGGADSGQVEEDFANWQATLFALYKGRLPTNTDALAETVNRLKPAHLAVEVAPQAWLEVPGGRYLAMTCSTFLYLQSRDGE